MKNYSNFRISDNLLDQVINLCPNFHLVLNPKACQEYILQYLAKDGNIYSSFSSIQIIYCNIGFNQLSQSMLQKTQSTADNLSGFVFFIQEPSNQIQLLATLFTSLSQADNLKKLKSLGMLVDGAITPGIFQDRRLALKHIAIVAFCSAVMFHRDVGRLLSIHADTLEELTLFYPDIKYPEGISNFQFPEMPKLRELGKFYVFAKRPVVGKKSKKHTPLDAFFGFYAVFACFAV